MKGVSSQHLDQYQNMQPTVSGQIASGIGIDGHTRGSSNNSNNKTTRMGNKKPSTKTINAEDRPRNSPPRRVQARPVRQPQRRCRGRILHKPGGFISEMQAAPEVLRLLQRQSHDKSPLLGLDEGLGPHQLADLPW